MPPVEQDRPWSLVVPVKRLERAKSRISGALGAARTDLALAVACDTVMAAVTAERVGAVFVVTEDEQAAEALAELGARVVGGEPGTGLNPALAHGAAVARDAHPEWGRCALSADLPALRSGELDGVLAQAHSAPTAFLADAPGVGTTLYAARAGARFAPAFEGGSRRRHLAGGAAALDGADAPSVRRDVDTAADLREAARLGVGPHTAKLLARVGW
ncbi:2-phospho-L-lactate guanylyltransferase [Streptomonospora litoralis]|uniref:Phosphoenolpyruvate guanylyltransferase n=1 Tax=Streptomonospora litoralis TaxID=2498135 RepID=A0A4P6Q2V8_9ACTN|nr:2-phospho-L-lactate guanylyltransferase [Streptomonospora litoralis]QBI52987.1 2-phospho-L-lactate guanylyltransferase [Streptomonospora litoralis]